MTPLTLKEFRPISLLGSLNKLFSKVLSARLSKEKKKEEAEFEIAEDASDTIEEHIDDQGISLAPLNMEDMRHAKNKVTGSFAAHGSNMKRPEQWNALYGERG
ncbi:hypothetical protein MTR_5g065205 [Medicago truncatula]|uniref:Uncharacterized protein n=1 Tax=Medicago truncatula TaxID=3880 RepID=A0A072UF83_MEDTR|nr:hypothetical protein MTR_5g065205 [Medicago truncatula]